MSRRTKFTAEEKYEILEDYENETGTLHKVVAKYNSYSAQWFSYLRYLNFYLKRLLYVNNLILEMSFRGTIPVGSADQIFVIIELGSSKVIS